MKKTNVFLLSAFLMSLLTGCGSNKHVTIGMTKKEVMKLLGDPSLTEKDEGKWYYFDSSFNKKFKKMNSYLESENEADIIRARDIYDELTKMHCKYRYIHFEGDKVNEYFYDADHKYDEDKDYRSWEKKTKDSVTFSNFKKFNCYKSGETVVSTSDAKYTYEAKYTDKSIYRAVVAANEMVISGNKSSGFYGSWKVEEFDSFKLKIDVKVYDGYVNVQYDKKRNSVSGIGFYNSGDRVNLVANLKNGYEADGWYGLG